MIYGDFNFHVKVQHYDNIVDITHMPFSLTLFRIAEPKLARKLILNETNTFYFCDLTDIEDNNYIEITATFTENKTIDYFFVTDSNYGTLDFYDGQLRQLLSP